jgi:LacI family transcriptional regulator
LTQKTISVNLEEIVFYRFPRDLKKTISVKVYSGKKLLMAVTLEEIAKASGFSVPTVSRALTNSSYPVSAATRQHILNVAKAMGYKPNLAARSLRTDQTNTIGVIVDDLLSPFIPPIVRGIQDYLKQFDYLSLIINSDWDPAMEQDAVNALISRPVDGIIFAEYPHVAANEALQNSNKPYIFVHRLFGATVANSVVPDDHYGASLAVKHLVELGHRRIAYINGRAAWHSNQRRLDGYRDELMAQGIPFDPALVQPGDWEYEGGYTAAKNLLQLKPRPTAIFSANDVMALGVIAALQDAGLHVPKDMAVVGYDNRDFAAFFRPRLTTVNMPVYEMGRTAAELLLRQIEEGQRATPEIKIKGQLFVRESCGADESKQTKELLNIAYTSRRVLLDKDPDSN